MTTKQVTQCDVFPRRNDSTGKVGRVKVGVYRVNPAGDAQVELYEEHLDLSQQAIDRLLKFVERGTTPPTRKKTKPTK